MRDISGGYFQMGSPSSEKGRESDEKQHRVYVDDFKINKTEVTLKAFKQFINDSGYTTDAEKDTKKNGCVSRKDGGGSRFFMVYACDTSLYLIS